MKRLLLSVALIVPLAASGAMPHGAHAAVKKSVGAPTDPKRVAVVLLNFKQKQGVPTAPEPWTKAEIRELWFTGSRSVAAYYSELSGGRMSITGDVFGYLLIKASTRTCKPKAWRKAADKLAAREGINLAGYTNVVYAFPRQQSCWWSGLARSGNVAWINGEMSLYIAAHELGHNLGLHHAASLNCKSGGVRVAFSSSCKADEYGDPFDTMGFMGARHFHTWHRMRLGLLAPEDVRTVTASGTFRLAPAQGTSDGPRILRVQRPKGDFYYLELRRPAGAFDDFPAASWVANGVTIRIAPDLASKRSRLIDTVPQTLSFHDAPLTEGRTFADKVNRIYVTLVSLDSSGAQVRVKFGGSEPESDQPPTVLSDKQPPTPPTNLDAFVSWPRVATLRWHAAGDNVGVDHYRVDQNGSPYAITRQVEIDSVRVKDGASYRFEVRAVDAAGNVSEPAALAFAVPDTTPPGQVFGLTGRKLGKGAARLRWLKARDNVAVTGYQVRRDGVVVATLPRSARKFADKLLPSGVKYTYTVAALDAAGNLGPASVATVKVR